MRIPFVIFGIDPRATAIAYAIVNHRPHDTGLFNGFTNHLPLAKLDARGMTYACRLLGEIAIDALNRAHSATLGKLNIFLPPPSDDDGFVDQSSNVCEIVIERGKLRELHVAVGVTGSALMLNVAARRSDVTIDAGRFVSLAELDALGPEAASITVGNIILRRLIGQHSDAFAPYPTLSFQPIDQP